MKNGLNRFLYYLQKVNILLDQSGKQHNPAMWLFTNNARTPFFMLEGLAKIYAEIHNRKKFEKLNEHFKAVEDALGQIDYYHWLLQSFESNKKIPADFRQYVVNMSGRSEKQLNELLLEKEWLSAGDKRIEKIEEKLNEVEWLDQAEEVEAFRDFYNVSITSVSRFVSETRCHFENVEKDVHELRRKLRWMSIYPQALQGAIQYSPDTKAANHLQKYLTNEIINSPYNKLPDKGNNASFLLVDKNYFLALSWLIAQLGFLKDEGLLLTGLCDAIKQNSSCSEEEIIEKARSLLGVKQRTMRAILDNAEEITKTFFKEDNLRHLLV
jgi:hypothetical protein